VIIEVNTDVTALKQAGETLSQRAEALQELNRELELTQEELLQAKEAAEAAERAKSEFLTTMSHELRTPLQVILGYTYLLLDGGYGGLMEQQADTLRRVEQNAQMLRDLINTVLDLNRLEAGRLPLAVQAVDVPELLQAMQQETQGLQDQSPLTFTWQVAEDLPVLHTDPDQLKIVLKNLLTNAVKFTPAGSVTVAAQPRREGIEFSVADTGVGIAPEAQAVIFEPFRQVANSAEAAQSGSGLGLHIVKRLLEALGGTIGVESESGRGSTFRVWMRVAPSSQEG